MCHNKNITLDGITFKNMKYGHFIEMDASKNVTVNNCTFTGYKASKRHTSEAINLDTPDKKTKGFTHDWSKYDNIRLYHKKLCHCYQRSPPLLLEVGDFPNIRLPVLLCLHSYHSQKS